MRALVTRESELWIVAELGGESRWWSVDQSLQLVTSWSGRILKQGSRTHQAVVKAVRDEIGDRP